jgi:hypothetical protein
MFAWVAKPKGSAMNVVYNIELIQIGLRNKNLGIKQPDQ